jgi:hypothetical protein
MFWGLFQQLLRICLFNIPKSMLLQLQSDLHMQAVAMAAAVVETGVWPIMGHPCMVLAVCRDAGDGPDCAAPQVEFKKYALQALSGNDVVCRWSCFMLDAWGCDRKLVHAKALVIRICCT